MEAKALRNPFSGKYWDRFGDLVSRIQLGTHHGLAYVLGTLVFIVLLQFPLDGLNGILFDGLSRLFAPRANDPQIALVGFDDSSSLRYSRELRIPAAEIEALFSFLVQAQPKYILLLSSFGASNYSQSELQQLSRAFAKLPTTHVGYIDDESLGRPQPTNLGLFGRYLPGFISRDTFSYGADSVTRRVMVQVEGIPTVYAKIACEIRGLPVNEQCWSTPRYERIGESVQTYIKWKAPNEPYPIYSSALLAEHKLDPALFKNKIVLIGSTLSSHRVVDFILTPFSRDHLRTPALEGAAQGLSTLIHDDGIRKTPREVNWALALFTTLLSVTLSLFFSPGRAMVLVLAQSVLLLAIGSALLFVQGLWINLAHPIILAFSGYYLVIPFRLVDEYRKRWHYQEQTELLAELEKMKSNFLSLVSHDFKTPIARIQGSAELMLSDGKSLSERQNTSLRAILKTTDEMTEFVEALLDITRIENNRMPLMMMTKDINSVVREIVEIKTAYAQEKEIEIQLQLEPIFAFKFDSKLIRRVLSNLIENAIKYSGPRTVVTISSEEAHDKVRISVADQGVGIAPEDLQKVFMKFFRCESDNTKAVKGTGLGLYLAQYFIELHHGTIELKSDLGRGSTFTVVLPVT